MAKLEKITDPIRFYDNIAPEYNASFTPPDELVRRIFSETFLETVKKGTIMDFGGGTGLDLMWMVQNFQKVYFMEPSEKMREIARETTARHHMKNLVAFLENHLDFNLWSESSLPTQEKMDGIAANFAVFNCIENLELLFEKLSIISNKNGHILATVINTNFVSIWKNYSPIVAIKSIMTKRLRVYNNHKGTGHPTYFFQLKYLKSSSSKFFRFMAYKPVPGSPFAILILSKK